MRNEKVLGDSRAADRFELTCKIREAPIRNKSPQTLNEVCQNAKQNARYAPAHDMLLSIHAHKRYLICTRKIRSGK